MTYKLFAATAVLLICASPAQADQLPSNLSGIIGSMFGQSWKPKLQPLNSLSGGAKEISEELGRRFNAIPKRKPPAPLPHKKGERYAWK